jgi:UPF0755 protein
LNFQSIFSKQITIFVLLILKSILSNTMAKRKSTKRANTNKFIKYILIISSVTLIYGVYVLFAPNIYLKTDESSYLCIPDSSSFEQVILLLEKEAKVLNVSAITQTALLFRYPKSIRSGRYELSAGMNNFQLIRKLRSGSQTPVQLTFNNIRTKEQLAGKLGKQLMADSASILFSLNDSAFLVNYNLTPATSISLFIPNTYEIFWNTNVIKLFERMHKEYTIFWTEDRKVKAAAIPLSQAEVSTLASIVEEETNSSTDRPMVAGLYINRLRQNMPLQADPTVRFALNDFTIKRILFGHLRVESPYNTYRNKGLPPGPIRIPTPKGIDAVLNHSKHNYLYMCASASFNGEHDFAVNYADHLVNAARYQRKLNELKIFK